MGRSSNEKVKKVKRDGQTRRQMDGCRSSKLATATKTTTPITTKITGTSRVDCRLFF